MTTWYVRPAGGSYGNEDGTTYADAWDGLLNVVWGGAGVVPGDTLYVCGLHVHTATTVQYITTQANITPVTGTSGNIITLRGDYSGDAGTIWGAYKVSYETWADEGDGAWSLPNFLGNHQEEYFFEDIAAGSWTLLTKKDSLQEVKDTASSFFFDNANDVLYASCGDQADPTGRIYPNRMGYDFQMDDISYMTFKDIKFYCLYQWFQFSATNPSTNITFDGCTLQYGEGQLIAFRDGCNDGTVDGCNLSLCNNAIYGISSTSSYAVNITISDNTIHDIGTTFSTYDIDAHAISFQGGDNIIIEDNYCYNCGNTILLYTFTDQTFVNSVVRRNFVKDAHTSNGTTDGYGICLQCNNDSLSDKSNNKIYQNIVTNCADAGLRDQWEDETEWYNNVVHNCKYGFSAQRSYNNTGPNSKLRNNIFLSNTTYHINWGTGADNYTIDMDYNQFHPVVGDVMNHSNEGGAMTVTEWKALSVGGSTFDPNSQTGDPTFVNAGGSYDLETDFQIPTGSPCKDAGVDVGLTTDYIGLELPSGADFDIGAYEFHQGGSVSQYYLNTASTGSGDGTTQAITGANAAWKAISEITGLSAGDTVSFNKGNTWREILYVPTSGSSGSVVTFNSHGSGNKPIINGADVVSAWTAYSATLEPTPAASDDDGYIKETTESITNLNNDLWMGLVGGEQLSVHARFTLNVSQGETITAAYITITANGDKGDGAELDIYAHDTDNASQITTFAHWTTALAAKTAATTNWDLPVTTLGQSYQSPSIIDVVQEIVDRGSWSSGNSILLLLDSSSSSSEFQGEQMDEGNNPPVLHVEYSIPNVWQATLTTEPSQVFFDGVKGTDGGSIVGCNSAREWYWAANVLYVYSTSDPDTAYTSPGIEASVRWANIDLDNDDYITIDGLDLKYGEQRGMTMRNGASNIIIQNTTAQYNYGPGIDCDDSSGPASDTVTIDGCTTRYNGESGIAASRYSTNWTIKNNNCQYDNQREGYEAGIKCWGPNSGGHIIEHNTCNNAATNGAGIWVDQVHDDKVIVRYNLCESNADTGIFIEKSEDCEVYYNINFNNSYGIDLYGTNAEPVGNTLVYNNVCYANTSRNINVRGDGVASIVNNLLRNNICFTSGGYELAADDGGENDGTNGTGNVYEYNCFGAESANFILWGVATPDTYDAWETAYGATTNSVESDPLMTDPANDDFTLQITSPCMNTGTDVSLTTDYAGESVTVPPNIGAYETLPPGGGGGFGMTMTMYQT